MINYLKIAFSIFICVSALSIFLLIISLLLTRKYNSKYRSFYGIFLGNTKRETLLFSANLLNLITSFYFLFNINYFNSFGLYMIIIINIIACLFSLSFYLIIANVLYTFITCALLLLLSLINGYLSNVVFDSSINTLKIIFMIIISMFITFITIRKLEVIIKTNKNVRRLL